MFGFLRRHDLTTAIAEVEAAVTTMEAKVETAVMRSEELHELTTRLIKRFETRMQREKEKAPCMDEERDTVTERVQSRRKQGRLHAL